MLISFFRFRFDIYELYSIFLYVGNSFENVPQLHRLRPNGMKLSEFVGLVPVSIVVYLKNFENLTKGSKWGAQFEISRRKPGF